MKTVGIITVHRLPNWGSAMQAYALQKAINSLGYKSQIIDYKYTNPYHWKRGKAKFATPKLKTRIGIWLGLRPPRLQTLIDKFISKEVNATRPYNTFEDLHENVPRYDIYCSGSDQIWNYKTMCCDPTYMLDFAPETCKRIAYSSSFSVNQIPTEYQEIYKVNLSKFSALSVREQNGCNIIKGLLNREAKLVLDPTLLLNKQQWGVLVSKACFKKEIPSKYILCYMLGYTYDPNTAMASLLEQLQKKHKCPVISIGRPLEKFKGNIYQMPQSQGIGVYEFLWLIKNATVVATSSFHGTAFSVNMGTPFISLVEFVEQEDDRITSFLNKVGLANHLVTVKTDYKHLKIDENSNIEQAQEKLSQLREDSLSYLQQALEK